LLGGVASGSPSLAAPGAPGPRAAREGALKALPELGRRPAAVLLPRPPPRGHDGPPRREALLAEHLHLVREVPPQRPDSAWGLRPRPEARRLAVDGVDLLLDRLADLWAPAGRRRRLPPAPRRRLLALPHGPDAAVGLVVLLRGAPEPRPAWAEPRRAGCEPSRRRPRGWARADVGLVPGRRRGPADPRGEPVDRGPSLRRVAALFPAGSASPLCPHRRQGARGSGRALPRLHGRPGA